MPDPKLRILVLGGTGEALALSFEIRAQGPQYDLIYSLAGRTPQPAMIPQATRIGGFGGVAGLISFLRTEAVDALIDATHPFASRISEHAVQACNKTAVAHLVLARKPWRAQPGDRWTVVDAIEQTFPECIGHRVFLALGASHIKDFAQVSAQRFVVRSATPIPGLQNDRFVWLPLACLRDLASERALLQKYRIDQLICRNSGGAAAYAKIEAARELGVNVMLIRPPPLPNAEICDTVAAALAWLKRRHPARSEAP